MTAALGKIHTHTHIGFYFVARSLFTAIKPYIPRFSFSNVAIPYQVTHTHTHTQWDRLLQQEFMMNTLHYEQLLLFIDRNFKVIRTSMTYCDACQINRKEVIIKRIISNLHNESTKRNETKKNWIENQESKHRFHTFTWTMNRYFKCQCNIPTAWITVKCSRMRDCDASSNHQQCVKSTAPNPHPTRKFIMRACVRVRTREYLLDD